MTVCVCVCVCMRAHASVMTPNTAQSVLVKRRAALYNANH